MPSPERQSDLSPVKRVLLEQRLRGQASSAGAPDAIPRLATRGSLPLSFAQERLWFLDRLAPGRSTYVVPSALRLTGALDMPALRLALSGLAARHEILRTRFPVGDGNGLQEVLPYATVDVAEIDLRGMSARQRDEHIRARMRLDADTPFDLAAAPPWRVTVLRAADDESVLVLTLHHMLTDGWSSAVLVRDLTTLYEAAVDAGAAALPPLPLQYGDYAAWQRSDTRRQQLEDELAYWRAQLAGLEPLVLPTDRVRPAMTSGRGASIALHVPLSTLSAVQALAQREEATLFMVLLAGLQIVLARWSGHPDVAVGTPVANRIRPELHGLIGLFANELVLRTDVDANLTARDFIRRVRETCLAAYTHQQVPFDRIVAELRPERHLDRTPLFQVMLTLQNAPSAPLKLRGLSTDSLAIESAGAKCDLEFIVRETPEGLAAHVVFAADLFEPASVTRLAGHWWRALSAMADEPTRRIGDIDLLSDDERHRVLIGWNQTARDFGTSSMVPELCEAQALRTPDAVALWFDQDALTHAAVHRRANQLARHLRARGVAAESRVGLCVHRSFDLVIGALGILKSGAAYVPLDPQAPPERLRDMLRDAQLAIVLTHAALRDLVADAGTPVLYLDEDAPAIACEADTPPASHIDPATLASLIYTSGTTGRPKGVMNTHGGFGNRLLWMRDRYPMGPGDPVLHKTPIGFDVSLWELFLPLITGAAMVIARPGGHQDDGYLRDTLRRYQIATVHYVPSMLRAMLANGGFDETSSLTRIICSGEALGPELVRALHANLHVDLHNLYGPTEASIDVTAWECRRTGEEETIPIGAPIANTRLYVLDDAMQPQPIGVPGELWIGGVGLARGYFNRPALTAERFCPSPFDPPGARLYRTGDRARWRTDGQLEYLGRLDRQVKVRGNRVELGEIEAALERLPAVRAAAVLQVPHGPHGEARLVAYVVPRDPALDVESLRAQLQVRVPLYMVPARFVFLDDLPLTASGKLDRRALPAASVVDVPDASYVAPRTPAESTLARIWQDVLGVGRVGIDDNFFALGGDSILSLQVVSRARSAGLAITPRQMFEWQTVAELASVAEAMAEAVVDDHPALAAADADAAPLTPIQHTFFEDWRLAVPAHFNQTLLFALPATVDSGALEAAVQAVVAQHDALRLRFARGADGQWEQAPSASPPGELYRRCDLRTISPAQQLAALEQDAAATQRTLDLRSGSLARIVEYQLDPAFGRRLLMVVHHLAVDGVSWRILLEDLEQAYTRALRGEPAPRTAAGSSMRTWAQRLLASHALFDQEVPYWTTRPVAAALPRDMPEATGTDNTFASERTRTVTLDAAETSILLRELPAAGQAPIEDVLLTALTQTLSAWSGQPGLLVALEGHGREDIFADVDLSRTVGWFTTLYPVALTLAPAVSPGEALRQVSAQLRQVPRRGLGYGVLRASGVSALADLPVPEISFNYMGQLDQLFRRSVLFEPAGEHIGSPCAPENTRPHVLAVQAMVLRGSLHVTWHWSQAFHRPDTIAALAADYLSHLRALIAHGQRSGVGAFPVNC